MVNNFRTLRADEIDLHVYCDGTIKTNNDIPLKKYITPNGYEQVQIGKGKNRKKQLVHRLVAKAFIPNLDNKPCVNHIDGNKKNNNVNNLEWCTHSENELHSYRVLGKKVAREHIIKIVKKHSEKFSKKVEKKNDDGLVIEIYKSLSDASKSTGISEGNISMCCNGKRKSAGGFVWNFVN